MRTHALIIALLVSVTANAGEFKYLGRLTSTGTSVNNTTTAVPFQIPNNAKITIYCDAAARVLHENESTANSGATMGVPIPATTLFASSALSAKVRVSGVLSAVMAMISISGTSNCDVWLRSGTE